MRIKSWHKTSTCRMCNDLAFAEFNVTDPKDKFFPDRHIAYCENHLPKEYAQYLEDEQVRWKQIASTPPGL